MVQIFQQAQGVNIGALFWFSVINMSLWKYFILSFILENEKAFQKGWHVAVLVVIVASRMTDHVLTEGRKEQDVTETEVYIKMSKL